MGTSQFHSHPTDITDFSQIDLNVIIPFHLLSKWLFSSRSPTKLYFTQDRLVTFQVGQPTRVAFPDSPDTNTRKRNWKM